MARSSWRRPIVLGLLTLSLLASPPAMAGDDGGAPMLEGPNVIDYEHATLDGKNLYEPVELTDSVRFIRQGRPGAGGGCEFANSGVAVGAGALEVEMAYDPDTCRSLIEAGTPVNAEPPASEDDVDSISANDAMPSGTSGDLRIASHATWWARATQQFDEPARWVLNEGVDDAGVLPPVTRATNYVQWTPDGTCAIAPGTTGFMGYEHSWYAFTGWELTAHTWNRTPDGACRTVIYSESWLDFRNNEFCAYLAATLLGGLGPIWDIIIDDTFTKYEPNHIGGNADGTYNIKMVASKGGGCHELLRWKNKHERIQVG